jgi:molybdenum cofactor biosynthesis enzyme MoaA
LGRPEVVRRDIAGRSISYDRRSDLIFEDAPAFGRSLNRTQVASPVDACFEVTTRCNMTCVNCFSDSARGRAGLQMRVDWLRKELERLAPRCIRFSISGGEPFLHPSINEILALPGQFPESGFVITTNGTVKKSQHQLLAENEWLVAVSLHGRKAAHNEYTSSQSFDRAVALVRDLCPRTFVHIYSVLNDHMTQDDLEWLTSFRRSTGAAFLRFIVPRPFGRYARLESPNLVTMARQLTSQSTAVKESPSLTLFGKVNHSFDLSH